jgi:hypothetical protein
MKHRLQIKTKSRTFSGPAFIATQIITKWFQLGYRMDMHIDILNNCAIIWEERKDSLKTLECVFLFNKFVLGYFAARRPIAANKI